MEATIKAIDQNGVWNGMDKKLVTVSTGQQYTFFVKEGTPFPHNVGERIEFEVTNDKYNNAKLSKTGYNKSYSKPASGNYSKDDLIMRQTALKASVELHRSNQSFRIDVICEDAQEMFEWLKR
jgi:hypothetical protein